MLFDQGQSPVVREAGCAGVAGQARALGVVGAQFEAVGLVHEHG